MSRTRWHYPLLGAVSGLILAFAPGRAVAQPAPNANSILILGASIHDPAKSVEAIEATALGYTVVFADDTQWRALSAADFGTYRAIVLGDGMCQGGTSLAAAEANGADWGTAVTGNVVVVGTHPGSNPRLAGARAFVDAGLRFAAGGLGTGAYITPRCYISPMAVDVPVLAPFGAFKVASQNACPNQAALVTSDPAFSGLTADQLSNWKCTADASFVQWPAGWEVVAMATNASPATYIAPSGVSGSPYILMRRESVAIASAAFRPSPSVDVNALMASAAAPAGPLEAASDAEGVFSAATAGSALATFMSTMATATIPLPVSDRFDLFPPQTFSDTVDGVSVGGTLSAYMKWSPASKSDLSWDSDKLRQGETPGMTNAFDPGTGVMKLAAEASLYLDGISVGKEYSLEGNCALGLTDTGAYDCSIPVDCIEFACVGIGVIDLCGCVELNLQATVTPSDFKMDRTVYYAGTAGTGPDIFTFPPRTQSDPFKVSCYVNDGDEAVYELANPRTDVSIGFGFSVGVGFEECDVVTGCNRIFTVPIYSSPALAPPIALNLKGTGGQTSLGTVLPDDTPPDLSAVNASYGGLEGSPIQFSAAGTADNCIETVTFVWDYSDLGVAFGFSPFHTFADNGTFSGQLRATDRAGNSATKDLSIAVANVKPAVNAGPDMASAWGVPVVLNGSATDPGSADQPTLHYEWSFGDGTPSATGGPNVTHAYAMPGTFTARLTVCDKNGACDFDDAFVTVRKRNVVIGYLGDQNGVFDTLTTLKASLTDELGAFVQGRTVSFAIGAEAGGSASTDALGMAATTHLLGLPAGSYSVTATFGGDPLYQPAGTAATFTEAMKPTAVAYTGALTGGPNKIVSLIAQLQDSSGKALAGRTVAFVLGSQSASAVTDSNGIATTTLKLNQKNGTYPLTATYEPAGSDATRYVGSSTSTSFKLQSK